MNDSVREELQTKIVSGSGALRSEAKVETPVSGPIRMEVKAAPRSISAKLSMPAAKPAAPKTSVTPAPSVPAKPAPRNAEPVAPPKPPARSFTSELSASKTSPTLVGFQPKNSTLPDWRLQLANAVRTRKNSGDEAAPAPGIRKQPVTSGANALKAEVVEEPAPVAAPDKHKDPRVAAALARINESRKAYLPEAAKETAKPAAEPNKNYPFNIVSRNPSVTVPTADNRATINAPVRPRVVPPVRVEKKGFDTNKLPALDAVGFASPEIVDGQAAASPAPPLPRKHISVHIEDEYYDHDMPEAEVAESEEIDDLPLMSMRFSAGIFDLIVGAGASLVLLLPFVIMGGDWFSLSGLVAFIPTCAIVMFVYLTAAVGFYGRTLGMRLFSLELIDAEENEYPTLHQSAVNAAVYLLSLALAGAGFITVLFNDEKRAAHDILSGTIMVKEF